MNVDELTSQLNQNLSKLLSPVGYKNILNRANNLSTFDVINRILIEMQKSNAFEIRTEEDWALKGRRVKKNANIIYILLPKYSYRYKDRSSGEILTTLDLNSNELKKAIEYNIIEKVEILDDLFCIEMYDIRDTVGNTNTKYIVNKPKITIKNILSVFSEITGATIEKCDETYYSKSANTLFICNQSYQDIVSCISRYLSTYYIDNRIDKILNETFDMNIDELSDYDKQLLEDSISYSISTLVGVNINKSFDIVRHTSNDMLTTILNITDNVVFEIVQYLEFNTDSKVEDAISNISRLRKSEALLNILEANNILNKMKGA